MRIAVAMSGGVDSSFAALLLKNEGHEVTGVTAWLWRCGAPRLADSACCGSVEGLKRARAAAEALGLEHHVVDLSGEFEERVVTEAARTYASGRTPNPCVLCNSEVRFPGLVNAARGLGAEGLATGHYARLLSREGAREGVRLLRGRDPDHDQSYFLFAVRSEHLAFTRFPLGEVTKAEVRALLAAEGHPAARARSSQDLCFATATDVPSLVASRSPETLKPGRIVHVDGRPLGTHRGLAHYTVGQRKGIGVALGEPLYVVELRPETNELVVGPDVQTADGPEGALWRRAFGVGELTWLAPVEAADGPVECDVQIRYRMKAVPAVVRKSDTGARVELSRPVRAVAPGQAAVFYGGEEVLGGGWIVGPRRQGLLGVRFDREEEAP